MDNPEELIRELAKQNVSRGEILKRGLKLGLSATSIAAILVGGEFDINVRHARAAHVQPNTVYCTPNCDSFNTCVYTCTCQNCNTCANTCAKTCAYTCNRCVTDSCNTACATYVCHGCAKPG